MGSGTSSQSPAVRKAVEVPTLKIAVIGDSQVGKTSILTRYIHNQFSHVYVKTHKAYIENVVRKLNVPGHAKVPVAFWDIPSQEDLPLHSTYFTDLDAVIVVVDISDSASLESATLWRQTVLSTASFTSTDDQLAEKKEKEKKEAVLPAENSKIHSKNVEDIPFLLLGNKLDLCLPKKIVDDIDITTLEAVEKGDSEKCKPEDTTPASNKNQQLEEIAATGFVGSVAVSALNNDLSVHAAIQTFLRHILDKQNLVQRKWLPRDESQQPNKQVGRPRYQQTRQLIPVGIQEIDTKFEQAEEILYRVTSLQRYQEDSLRKFASQCVDVGVISSTQDASMQNCLVALRDKLVELDLKLQLKVDGDFCHLEVKASTEDAVLDKDIRYTVKTFNKEYAAVTKAMLAEFPVAQAKLVQIEAQVDELCKRQRQELTVTPQAAPASSSSDNSTATSEEHSYGVTTGSSGREVRLGSVVEKNRAVLRHVAHECHDCLAHIQRSVKQAKAAFVW